MARRTNHFGGAEIEAECNKQGGGGVRSAPGVRASSASRRFAANFILAQLNPSK